VRLAGLEGVAFSPLAKGEHDREQIAPDVGEHVLQAAARGRGLLGEDAAVGERAPSASVSFCY